MNKFEVVFLVFAVLFLIGSVVFALARRGVTLLVAQLSIWSIFGAAMMAVPKEGEGTLLVIALICAFGALVSALTWPRL